MTTQKSKSAAKPLLVPAAINILKRNIFFILLCIPPQGLGAEEPNNRLIYDNEYWTLKDLPKIIVNTPAPKPEFAVFVVTKSSNGTWRIGGTLRNLDAELLYVDRKNRVIGPWTSKVHGVSQNDYRCISSRASQKQTQSKDLTYNACRSEFYSADKIVKGTQAFLACALLGCLFAYDKEWYPIFRPLKLEKAIIDSNLMAQLTKSFQSSEIQRIQKIEDEFKEITSEIQRKIEGIKKQPRDITGLRASTEMLDSLLTSYDQHRADSDQATEMQSRTYKGLGLALDESRWQIMSRKLTQSHELTKTKMIEIQNNIAETLSNLEIAERALIREIQSLLQEESYYETTVDGIFGLGTIAALTKFAADIGSPAVIKAEEKSTILKTIKSSLMQPDGECLSAANDAPYVACFSLK